MTKKKILVISTQQDDTRSALASWSHIPHPFHLNIAMDEEAAIELVQKLDFDMVVLDCTDTNIDHKKLNAVLPILQEDATLISYQGESEEEIEESVAAVFNAKKYKRLQRMLMMEPSVTSSFNLPPFSLN